MIRAIYPGSFDPVTYGHLDIMKRAAALVDELIVGVLNNNAKTPLFSAEERVRMLKDAMKDIENVKACMVIRGLRAITDFENELKMAQTNHKLSPKVETVFLTTSLEHAYLSSTVVKEVACFGGDISQFVPKSVEKMIQEKMMEKESVHQ